MAKEIRKLTFEGGTASYNANMPMGALSSLTKASASGDLDDMMLALSQFVTAWSFDGKPGDYAAWEALGRKEFSALITAVTEDMSELGEE